MFTAEGFEAKSCKLRAGIESFIDTGRGKSSNMNQVNPQINTYLM
jgi:hypothetical protein